MSGLVLFTGIFLAMTMVINLQAIHAMTTNDGISTRLMHECEPYIKGVGPDERMPYVSCCEEVEAEIMSLLKSNGMSNERVCYWIEKTKEFAQGSDVMGMVDLGRKLGFRGQNQNQSHAVLERALVVLGLLSQQCNLLSLVSYQVKCSPNWRSFAA